MPQLFTYLFINLAILLLSLATIRAGNCIVCGYDGRAYSSSNPGLGATNLCKGAKDEMPGCTGWDWYTNIKDPNHAGQKTYCRFYCPDIHTPCPGHKVEDENDPLNAKETLLGKSIMDCRNWPVSK
ncbi:uncharacterized protein MELLADRAFT_107981 [Melampsora larici-populina 98AG31]|uniref:Secreted protein n=1 Tax=Melampsora larici-populina (strain 98AG31 / pathotype 3-4-7) TaxID=747676 RepID=F4RRK7_MELLP|nr:uncharacterized protein MELLADRAFT_107981 [Melampsora larici-populina 98AG31]EGG05008.1 secreted protein [Melampsora larici-populina 98AG31]